LALDVGASGERAAVEGRGARTLDVARMERLEDAAFLAKIAGAHEKTRSGRHRGLARRRGEGAPERVSIGAEARVAADGAPQRPQEIDRRRARFDEKLLELDVAVVEKEDAARRLAVTAAAAGLLVVRLRAARQVGVDDEADVRLVDAHAE